jgi:hypothetical protein
MWELYIGAEKLADISMSGVDQPWFFGELSVQPPFEKYRPLFEKAYGFVKKGDFSSEESEEAAEAIDDLGLSLKDVAENKVYTDMMINIDDNEVWWRV